MVPAEVPVFASLASVGSGKNTRVVFAVLLRSNAVHIPRRCCTVRLLSMFPSTSPGAVSKPPGGNWISMSFKSSSRPAWSARSHWVTICA